MALFDASDNNIARWKLTTGDSWADTGGAGNGLTLTDVGSVANGTGFKGGANTAAVFGSSKCLYRAATSILHPGSFTISAWIYPTTLAGVNYEITASYAYPDDSTYHHELRIYTNNKVLFAAGLGGGILSSTVLSADTWYFVVATFDASGGAGAGIPKIYIGTVGAAPTLVATGQNSALAGVNNAPFVIGRQNASDDFYPFIGRIDDVSMWGRVLSLSEITSLWGYGENFAPPPTSATIAFTAADAVVAITANLIVPTATISFTTADAVVAITGGFGTGTISFTTTDAVVAITATQNIPTAAISFTTDNTVVAMTGSIKNTATFSFTTADAIVAISAGVPSLGYISFTTVDAVVSILGTVSAVTEPFAVTLRHKTTGAAITGLTTVLLTINQPQTGYRWDFGDNSFKASPTTPTLVLAEVGAANQPGLYRSLVTTTTWSGWVEFEATYNDGTFTYSYSGEAYYTNGVRANGSWSTVEWAGVNALPTLAEIEGSSILAKQAKLDFVEKWILNKLVESPNGDTITLYADDNITPLKTWTWNNSTKTRSQAT